MLIYLMFNEEGMVDRFGQANYPPPEAVLVDIPIDHSILSRFYLAERPSLPAPAQDGTVWTVSGCPLDTRVEVIDETGGEIMFQGDAEEDGQEFVFDLPDAGNYEITVLPPAPWMPIVRKVHVE
jgi:hypothetical protein